MLELPKRAAPSAGAEQQRWLWADNIRVVVIVGVIVTHVATAYILDIDWYYQERTAGAITEAIVAAVVLPAALFAMGALFFVAGLFAQRSVCHKGRRRFIRDRLTRLGLPLALFALCVGPATSLIGQRAEGGPSAMSAAYVMVAEARRADTGPMWFVAALLVFSVAYAMVPRPSQPRAAGWPPIGATLLRAGAVLVVATFIVRVFWPFAEDTPLSLNLWEWPQMAVLFGLGALAGERRWPTPLPGPLVRRCRQAGVVGLALLPALGVLIATGDKDAFLGGLHVQALAEPALEAVASIGVTCWLVHLFAERWNDQRQIGRAAARASFGAYFLHAPVVVCLMALLSRVALAVEWKFVIVSAAGVVASFAIASMLTQVPVVRRVL